MAASTTLSSASAARLDLMEPTKPVSTPQARPTAAASRAWAAGRQAGGGFTAFGGHSSLQPICTYSPPTPILPHSCRPCRRGSTRSRRRPCARGSKGRGRRRRREQCSPVGGQGRAGESGGQSTPHLIPFPHLEVTVPHELHLAVRGGAGRGTQDAAFFFPPIVAPPLPHLGAHLDVGGSHDAARHDAVNVTRAIAHWRAEVGAAAAAVGLAAAALQGLHPSLLLPTCGSDDDPGEAGDGLHGRLCSGHELRLLRVGREAAVSLRGGLGRRLVHLQAGRGAGGRGCCRCCC